MNRRMNRRPLIIAHRGYSAKYPENTRLAFLEAVKAGADGIECDIQQTRDGRWLVIHDETLERTTNGRGRVGDSDYEQIAALDFGGGEKVLSLDELLELIPQHLVMNIELKSETVTPRDTGALLRLLISRRDPAVTMISSFRHDLLPPFRRAGFMTGMLLGGEHQNLTFAQLFALTLKINPSHVNLPVLAFTRVSRKRLAWIIRGFRLLSRKICFWTVNEETEWDLIEETSHMVITDQVERMLDLRGKGLVSQEPLPLPQ